MEKTASRWKIHRLNSFFSDRETHSMPCPAGTCEDRIVPERRFPANHSLIARGSITCHIVPERRFPANHSLHLDVDADEYIVPERRFPANHSLLTPRT